MRREGLYLHDIVDAADAIAGFLEGRTKNDFLNDDFFRSAILQKLMVIGEAAAKLPESLRARYPEVPWVDIVGFRNRVVHGYFNLDWDIVWVTAVEQAPELRQQIATILKAEFPGSEPPQP